MLGSHNFIKKEISQNEKSITQTDYYSKFRELFDVKNNILYYKPLNLKIIPKDDKAQRRVYQKIWISRIVCVKNVGGTLKKDLL